MGSDIGKLYPILATGVKLPTFCVGRCEVQLLACRYLSKAPGSDAGIYGTLERDLLKVPAQRPCGWDAGGRTQIREPGLS